MVEQKKVLLLGIMVGALMGSCVAMNPKTTLPEGNEFEEIFGEDEGQEPEIVDLDQINQKIIELLSTDDPDQFKYSRELHEEISRLSRAYNDGVCKKLKLISQAIQQALERDSEKDRGLLLKKSEQLEKIIALLKGEIAKKDKELIHLQESAKNSDETIRKKNFELKEVNKLLRNLSTDLQKDKHGIQGQIEDLFNQVNKLGYKLG